MTQHCILIIAACYLRSRKYKKFTYYWSVKDLVQILGWKDVNFHGSRHLSLVWNLERKLYLSRRLHVYICMNNTQTRLKFNNLFSRQSCPSAFPFPAFMLIFGVSFLFLFFGGVNYWSRKCAQIWKQQTNEWL